MKSVLISGANGYVGGNLLLSLKDKYKVTALVRNTPKKIYDNVSYLSLEKGNMLKADFNPTGKISTSETQEPSMGDYVKELKKVFNYMRFRKLIHGGSRCTYTPSDTH